NPPHGAHCAKSLGVEDPGHVIELVGADAVLAGDAPAGRDAGRHDLLAGQVDPADDVGITPVERDVGVQVAIAGVEDIADAQPVAIPDLGDTVHDLGQRGAGDHGVLHGEVGRDPSHRAD